ncbi:OmpA family protein [Myroides albus]|uniref:OmpA family protein n=1 Tax=Myroides albus TaxID=2562892 RepID=A0A6I3LLS7_9FLAO|nr:OmpA family protein [Myroides albus]MTG99313.1 OmpA family protein [Myroides albus]UVD80219.1 OmpA family protein [Myroides albus]
MKIEKRIVLLLSVLCSLVSFGQGSKNKADREFSNLAYSDAIAYYEDALRHDGKNVELLLSLGDAYYFNGLYSQALKSYQEAMRDESRVFSADAYFKYVQTLKSAKNYAEADRIMDLMSTKFAGDNRVVMYKANKGYLKNIESNLGAFSATLMDKVNTPYSEYGAAMYKGHIIFASSQERNSFYQRIHSWTNDPFTKLYAAPVYIDGYVGESKLFSKKLDSRFNESTPTFSADGQTMYFSSNDRSALKKGETVLGSLYRAKLVDNKWTNIEKLPFNQPNTNTAHPALSTDEKWLYFVSDKAGGLGQSDIYRVEILSNGGFGSPENLGAKINTEGRESFPFISTDNVLYFASDGHPGLGGFDIYAVKINDDNSFGDAVNLGSSINSEYDDFAFYLDPNCKYGFMTSNRPGGIGKDDLYFVREITGVDLEFYQSLRGKVYNIVTNEVITDAPVSLYDHHHNLIETVNTDKEGQYIFKDKLCYIGYTIGVDVEGYNSIDLGLPKIDKNNEAVLDFGLDGEGVKPKQKVDDGEIRRGDDLTKLLRLEPIYFDFDRADIRYDAEVELYKVLEVMKLYPSMRVDVRAHTDNIGEEFYNFKLSQRRAENTMNWLIARGISRNRLTSRGFGGAVPVNNCVSGVPCSGEEHQANRRSEFIVEDI